MSENTKAARDVLAERQRQVEVEGWTPEHDDEHAIGELAGAAAAYACIGASVSCGEASSELRGAAMALWPFDTPGLKARTDDLGRRALVKAGALILAEIERIDRAEAASA